MCNSIRKVITLLIFCVSAGSTYAQTIEVSGIQSGQWDADTVLVTNDVTVMDSLSIAPGTIVVFKDYCGIDVGEGAFIKAIGTQTDSILFTMIDTADFSHYDVGRGGWNGINLDKAASSHFDYCVFQYGKASLPKKQQGGALCIMNCDEVSICHSTLRCNFSMVNGGAINAEHSKVIMRDCQVKDNLIVNNDPSYYALYGGGLRLLNCDVSLIDMKFLRNYAPRSIGGAISIDSCSVIIDRAVFDGNHGVNGGGLYLKRSNHKSCSISNSLFSNNISTHFGGGLAIGNASPEINNITVTRNKSIGVNCGGVFIYQNSAPVLTNCIIYGNDCEPQSEGDIQMWLWTYDDYAPEFHHCLIEGGQEQITGFEVIAVNEAMITEDPLFVDPDHHDFRLSSSSPCRDAGSPNTNPEIMAGYDLALLPRVCHEIIDIGAYEFSDAGVGDMGNAIGSVQVIGNPVNVSSALQMELTAETKVIAYVYSMRGDLVKSIDFGFRRSGKNKLDIGELASTLGPGMYLIEVSTLEGIAVVKIVR